MTAKIQRPGPPGPKGDTGNTGPAGPAGPAGSGSYRHQQLSPAATWNVAHNLGKRPSVTVIDSTGDVVDTSFSYVDDNHLIITFAAATGGEAYLN